MRIKLSELKQIIKEVINEKKINWINYPDASMDNVIDSYIIKAEQNKDEIDESIEGESEELEINSYCRDVAHLISNFTNVVDINGIILRRSLNYVGQKYNKDQVDAVKSILETNYNLSVDSTNEPDAPPAERSGPDIK